MHIAQVKLHDFKGFGGEAELYKKTLLLGANGSGKSRILEAIALAITGYDRDEFGQPVKRVLDILNNRATTGTTDMLVGIEWDNGFSVERQFQLAKNDAGKQIARCYPSLNEKTVKAVDARVESEIGFLPEMFNIFPILSKNAMEMRKYFLGLCETKAWSWSELVDKIKKVIGNTEIDKALLDQMEQIFQDNKLIEENLHALISLLSSEYSRLNKEVKQYEANTGTIADMKQRYDQDRINELKEEIAKLEALEHGLRNDINTYILRNEQIKELEDSLGEDNKVDVETLKTTILQLQEGITDYVPLDYKHWKTELETCEENRDKLEYIVQHLEEEITSLQAFQENEICPTCGQNIEGVLVKNEKIIKALQVDLQKEESSLDSILLQISEIKTKIATLDDEKASHNRQSRFYERQVSDLKAQLTVAKSRQKDEKKLAELKKKVSDVSHETLNGQLKKMEIKLSTNKDELRAQEAARDSLDGFRKAVLGSKEAAGRLEQIKVMQKAIGYKGIAGNVLRTAIKPFEASMNSLLSEIDKSFTGHINFESAAGREVFDLMLSGVSSKSISTGQRALFLSALQISLLAEQCLKYKCAFIDNIEAIDDFEKEGHRRTKFVKTLCRFVDEGLIDQFIGASSSGINWKPADDECKIVQMG